MKLKCKQAVVSDQSVNHQDLPHLHLSLQEIHDNYDVITPPPPHPHHYIQRGVFMARPTQQEQGHVSKFRSPLTSSPPVEVGENLEEDHGRHGHCVTTLLQHNSVSLNHLEYDNSRHK